MTPKVSEAYKEQKRVEILMAAAQVFQQKGFEPTTMKDIKEAANISFGSLYSYFSSTEEIFTKILEISHSQDDSQEKRLAGTAWEKIEYFLDSQAAGFEGIKQSIVPVAYEYFMTAWREEKRLPLLQNRYEQAVTELNSFIQEGITSGEFPPELSETAITKMIISMLEGLNISSLFLEQKLVEAQSQIDVLKSVLKTLLHVKEK
ncbi:TetR family transcriptional regulator [Neobacillus vireti]|uniref:TetR/AcrR family transcriptional regulator n=1 Tax=Neobacillus vireti LMG 21834 TaxID=1131730 RepID=A0AB94IML4_9BACI|nr:TetR family transcriptional regulator [Neobacillus vireti]ETI68336.1 TetR/AcrR family transcriptional regulator [Neobacillus vireti LMG 21834]KLT16294.1 hypothetical protein AA980_17485 [Neobacillus vireti]